MKKFMFKSALAPYIQGLLDQKRALGFKYDTEEYFLDKFDKYWIETNKSNFNSILKDYLKQKKDFLM